MTVPSSRHRAGSVLCCLLVLAAVLLSSLCATGRSATDSVRAEPASAAVDVRPAVGPLVGETAGEQGGVDVREAAAPHQTADPVPSDAGHCGKRATPDAVSAHDGSRPFAPPPAPQGPEHRTPAPPSGPDPASVGTDTASPAPDLVQLSVLRI
ncbi:hypothetical protein [Streptomyces sp. SMS_SU21]|uniref:hypothetical protein n=1 Tax=Streptomyces sp. SMS_SU21 TaxID=2069440 RepID=UPI0011B35CD0|nr:hypothetical protein [Streptomyces sp. SMS_SU21]MCA2204675.1 hypothetical protein [Streptomyces sp. SMS_SU21]